MAARETVLKTKLHPPIRRPGLVRRVEPLAKLTRALQQGCRLSLIVAPPGYGKSTLAATWAEETGRPTGWLSLDESDNDPVRFINYLTATLQQIYPEIGQAVKGLLASPQPPAAERLMALLIEEMTEAEGEAVLVLDDLQNLHQAEILTSLQLLVDQTPPGLHLVLIGREDPPLQLARWRVRAQLSEIRIQDLRFNTEDATVFLQDTMGLTIEGEQVGRLLLQTEGWAAGLQLAGLSLQGKPRIAVRQTVAEFGGSNRLVMDYLLEEVWAELPSDLRSFLVQTACLGRFNSGLCQSVTGRADSQQLLELLWHNNLFLLPLDEQGVWYRYHHLFADFLSTEMTTDLRRAVQERAAVWCESEGLAGEAVSYAFSAHSYDLAVRLLSDLAPTLLEQGELASLLSWIQALPAELLASSSVLRLYQTWCYFLTGRMPEVMQTMQSLVGDEILEQSGFYRGLLESLQALFHGGTEQAVDLAEQAVQDIGEQPSFFRAVALLSLGQARAGLGQCHSAANVFQEAYLLAERLGHELIAITALINLVTNLLSSGQRTRALGLCEEALAKRAADPSPLGEMIYLALGLVHYEGANLGEADHCLQRGITLCRRLGLVRMLGPGEWAWVLTLETLGERQRADAVLQETDQLTRRFGLNGATGFFQALQAELALRRRGEMTRALAWVNSADLPPFMRSDNAISTVQLTYAHALLQGKRVSEASSLLDGLVARATALGRLGDLIRLEMYQTLIALRSTGRGQALLHLRKAWDIGLPEGYWQAMCELPAVLQEFSDELRQAYPQTAERLAAALNRAKGAEPEPDQPPTDGLLSPLSERELEILQLVAAGLSNQQIAEQLFITLGTTKWHIGNIYSKLGVQRRTLAVEQARQLNLIS